MLVRLPERAVSPCERTLAYLVAAEADEPAAGIARAMLENGSLGNDFLFGAEGADHPTRSTGEAVEQVLRSARARAQGGQGLAPFLAQGANHGIRACILFVPPRARAWLDRVEEQILHSPGPFRAIIGVDGVRPSGKDWSWRKLLLRPEPRPGSKPAEVREVAERLRQAGAEVTILDRATGQTIAPHDLPGMKLTITI
jgi:hypothetical protein